MAKTSITTLETAAFSANGQFKKSPATKNAEPSLEELESQFEHLAQEIAAKREAQKPSSLMVITNTIGRLKSLTWVIFLGLAAVFLYNYIVINDLSMRPIDVAGLQKVLLSVIVFFMALLMVERSLKYFVPYLHHYFLNDRDSEQDFSTHLQQLKPYQLVCVTCFFIGLFFWGFVQILGVKW
jgi:hypothetical protein